MKEEGVTILPVVIVLILSIITGYVVSKVTELTYWISMPLGFVSTMFFIWVIGEIVNFFEPKSRLQKTNLNISEMVCSYCKQPYKEQFYASESINTFSVHCNNCDHDNIYKFSDYEAYQPLTQMPIKTKGFNRRFPCSVADTESGPKITWENHNLKIEFESYQCEKCTINFEEVSHFEFLLDVELDSKLYQYDGVVEVLESEIIKKLISVGEINENEAKNYKHIVIGFNEIGSYVSVVFKSMQAKCA